MSELHLSCGISDWRVERKLCNFAQSLKLPDGAALPPALPHPFSPTFSGRIIKHSLGMSMPSLPPSHPVLFQHHSRREGDWRAPETSAKMGSDQTGDNESRLTPSSATLLGGWRPESHVRPRSRLQSRIMAGICLHLERERQ